MLKNKKDSRNSNKDLNPLYLNPLTSNNKLIVNLTLFLLLSLVQSIYSNDDLNNKRSLQLLKNNSILSTSNYSLVFDSYDELLLFQLSVYTEENKLNDTFAIFQDSNVTFFFDSPDIKRDSNNSNITNSVTYFPSSELGYKVMIKENFVLITAKIVKDNIVNCSHYNTTYASVYDCNTEININNSEYSIPLSIRFIDKIIGLSLNINTKNSLLYAYEYNYNNIEIEDYYDDSYLQYSSKPSQFNKEIDFNRCDNENCREKSGYFDSINFEDFFFKLNFNSSILNEYDIKIKKMVLTVDAYQEQKQVKIFSLIENYLSNNNDKSNNDNEPNESDTTSGDSQFLSEENSISFKTNNTQEDIKANVSKREDNTLSNATLNKENSNNNYIEFYQDITHLLIDNSEYYQFSLDYFPRMFNLIITINAVKKKDSYSEEKIVLYINNIVPFKKYDITDSDNPNFLLIIVTLCFLSLLVLTLISVFVFNSLFKKNNAKQDNSKVDIVVAKLNIGGLNNNSNAYGNRLTGITDRITDRITVRNTDSNTNRVIFKSNDIKNPDKEEKDKIEDSEVKNESIKSNDSNVNNAQIADNADSSNNDINSSDYNKNRTSKSQI